jgi:hypothetical protein
MAWFLRRTELQGGNWLTERNDVEILPHLYVFIINEILLR